MAWEKWIEESLATFDCPGGQHRFTLVRFFDHTLAVLCNGRPLEGYRWTADQAELASDGFSALWQLSDKHAGHCCGHCRHHQAGHAGLSPSISPDALPCWLPGNQRHIAHS